MRENVLMDIKEVLEATINYANSIPIPEKLAILEGLETNLTDNFKLLLQELIIFQLKLEGNPDNAAILKAFVEVGNKCMVQQEGLRLVRNEIQRLKNKDKNGITNNTVLENECKVVDIEVYRNLARQKRDS